MAYLLAIQVLLRSTVYCVLLDSRKSAVMQRTAEQISNEVILVARILLVMLFVVFGWSKLSDFSGTAGYMKQVSAPIPPIAALVAIVVEFFGALAIIVGAWTRPLAILLAVYTLGTGLIAHDFWTIEGADRYANAINFYKNISIIGGFLLLYVTGAGKYSVDARMGWANPTSR
jgi:putative oxidoreductase